MNDSGLQTVRGLFCISFSICSAMECYLFGTGFPDATITPEEVYEMMKLSVV